MTDKELSNFEKLIGDLQRVSAMLETGYDDPDNAEHVDKAVDILHMIMQWTNAYPTDIFRPMKSEDWDEHHRLLKGANRSGTAAAADCMRFVVTKMRSSIEAMAK